jgi:ribonuclease P protein component
MDLSAQRAQAEAEARLPHPHGQPRRSRDPQAAPGEGPQAPLGLSSLDARVQRRHRLSRSRDFDAVYRHGRSVSTRFLVLYWFPREEDGEGPRLGLAVPKAVGTAVVRNWMKRRLREAFRARLSELPQDQDYVLVVRPGFAEAAEKRGFDWLGERVEEILGKAAA